MLSGWNGAPAEGSYRTAKADRGEVVATVNATGTINPTTTVIVGSQLSGQVVEILADYNSEVKAGQVVAQAQPGSDPGAGSTPPAPIWRRCGRRSS